MQSTIKKIKYFCIAVGILFFIIAGYKASLPIYNATITDISDMYYTHGAGDQMDTYYNVDVTVKIIGQEADQQIIEGVTIRRSSEKDLPEVGDTIQIYGHQEYRSLYGKVANWMMYGVISIALGLFLEWVFSGGKKIATSTSKNC